LSKSKYALPFEENSKMMELANGTQERKTSALSVVLNVAQKPFCCFRTSNNRSLSFSSILFVSLKLMYYV
jgi:hypothetical protein